MGEQTRRDRGTVRMMVRWVEVHVYIAVEPLPRDRDPWRRLRPSGASRARVIMPGSMHHRRRYGLV